MSSYTYDEIVSKAKSIKNNVEKSYKLGENAQWSYWIANAILTPKKNIPKFKVNPASKPSGDSLSRQIIKKDYLDMASRLVKYVNANKALPNYITCNGKKVKVNDYTYMFARILSYYDKNKSYPNYAELNSKSFTRPTETGNSVYDYFVKKTGKKYTTIDDLLSYVKANFKYEFYFDDHKSNKQVTDTRAGNCTDLMQWLWNMAKAMGYDCKCIHVKCRVSGTGHVRGQFRHPKNTSGKWINRDIAAVADGGSVTSLWCADGYKLAENPSWFMQNINR